METIIDKLNQNSDLEHNKKLIKSILETMYVTINKQQKRKKVISCSIKRFFFIISGYSFVTTSILSIFNIMHLIWAIMAGIIFIILSIIVLKAEDESLAELKDAFIKHINLESIPSNLLKSIYNYKPKTLINHIKTFITFSIVPFISSLILQWTNDEVGNNIKNLIITVISSEENISVVIAICIVICLLLIIYFAFTYALDCLHFSSKSHYMIIQEIITQLIIDHFIANTTNTTNNVQTH